MTNNQMLSRLISSRQAYRKKNVFTFYLKTKQIKKTHREQKDTIRHEEQTETHKELEEEGHGMTTFLQRPSWSVP